MEETIIPTLLIQLPVALIGIIIFVVVIIVARLVEEEMNKDEKE